jgi:hypothetical protein
MGFMPQVEQRLRGRGMCSGRMLGVLSGIWAAIVRMAIPRAGLIVVGRSYWHPKQSPSCPPNGFVRWNVRSGRRSESGRTSRNRAP